MIERSGGEPTRTSVVLVGLVLAAIAAFVIALVASQFSVAVAVTIGPPAASMGILVADRRRRETASKVTGHLERRFAALIDVIPDYVLVFDPAGRLLYASPSVERLAAGEHLSTLEHVLRVLEPEDAHRAREWLVDPISAPDRSVLAISTPAGRFFAEVSLRDERGHPDVAGVVVFARDVTAERQLRADLERQAREDDLTGLLNRRGLSEAVEQGYARARGGTSECAVVLIDLHRFKGVNDTLGHATGDAVLKAVASRLRHVVRDGEPVARLGGDEFAVFFEDDSLAAGDVSAAARRVLDAVQQPHLLGGQYVFIAATVGLATAEMADSPGDLLRKADIALYEAKRIGPDTVVSFHEELERLLLDEARIDRALSDAVTNGEFELDYQPLVALSGGSTTGFEALLRWRGSPIGEVSPASFIPVAERSGEIVRLGEWVIREACRRCKEWEQSVAVPLFVSVNVSPVQLRDEGFVDKVLTAVRDSEIDHAQLQLEITESVFIRDYAEISERLARLRERGVRVAIDDFGTGYSSLGLLQELPLDCVKIDQSFIAKSSTDSGRTILKTMLGLAETLGLSVVAEGVETKRQLSLMAGAGRVSIQGFLISPPLRGDEVAPFLLGRSLTATSQGS